MHSKLIRCLKEIALRGLLPAFFCKQLGGFETVAGYALFERRFVYLKDIEKIKVEEIPDGPDKRTIVQQLIDKNLERIGTVEVQDTSNAAMNIKIHGKGVDQSCVQNLFCTNGWLEIQDCRVFNVNFSFFNKVRLVNCDILQLIGNNEVLASGAEKRKSYLVELVNCRIGTLYFYPGCVDKISIENCHIYSIEAPSPPSAPPVTVDFLVDNVSTFGTRPGAIFDSPSYRPRPVLRSQPFRSLKVYAREWGDDRLSHRMRSIELNIEAHRETGVARWVLMTHSLISGYGKSLARPVGALLALYVVTVILGFMVGTEVNPSATAPSAWYFKISAEDATSQWARAAILGLQNFANPFSVFGYEATILSSSPWMEAYLFGYSVAVILLLFFWAAAIKRRFQEW